MQIYLDLNFLQIYDKQDLYLDYYPIFLKNIFLCVYMANLG